MLFTRAFKDGIRAGTVTRTYRRWKRQQAKVGGRYNLPGRIMDANARQAGFGDSPGSRAGYLAEHFDWDTATFKRQIRVGLTVSLDVGYELTARGRQTLEHTA